MAKFWTPIYETYFDMGIKSFSFHVADSYERRRLASSIRTYLANRNLDGTYMVETADCVISVTHKDLLFN